MSITAILWLGAYFLAAVLAFVHPIFGLYGYYLDYYAHPPLHWWGKALPDWRWSLTISIVALSAFLLRQHTLPELKVKSFPQFKWLILLVFTALAITLSPLPAWEEKSWEKVVELGKLAILFFLITRTVRTKQHFRYLILAQILGVLFWGWEAFMDPERRAGRLMSVGGTDTLTDNGAAAHILAILPLIGVMFLTGKVWEKIICLIAAPFAVNTFILCNSRGGFLGLLGAGTLGLFLTPPAWRKKVFFGVLAGGILLMVLADPQFIARQQTIQSYEEDTAATSRIASWVAALDLIGDNPLGSGGGGFEALSGRYIPDIVEAHEGELRSVHNTYLLVGTDWGIFGLIVFTGFLVSTLRVLYGIRKNIPPTPGGERLVMESTALMIGLLGVMIAGFFTNRLYAEVIYWFAAFAGVVKNLQEKELEEYRSDPENELTVRHNSRVKSSAA